MWLLHSEVDSCSKFIFISIAEKVDLLLIKLVLIFPGNMVYLLQQESRLEIFESFPATPRLFSFLFFRKCMFVAEMFHLKESNVLAGPSDHMYSHITPPVSALTPRHFLGFP